LIRLLQKSCFFGIFEVYRIDIFSRKTLYFIPYKVHYAKAEPLLLGTVALVSAGPVAFLGLTPLNGAH
jgi:hypothetical protein